MMIILKCIEISNHYIVYQELTKCCRSIILQKQTNKHINKDRKRGQVCGYQRQGGGGGEIGGRESKGTNFQLQNK